MIPFLLVSDKQHVKKNHEKSLNNLLIKIFTLFNNLLINYLKMFPNVANRINTNFAKSNKKISSHTI